MTVLLFDIDGTLIRSGGAGKHAMEAGLKSAFQVPQIRDRVSYSGRTDPGIAAELLELHGVEPTQANVLKLREAYLGHLPRALKSLHGSVLPGVSSLLDRIGDRYPVGLMTGNIRQGAEIKLKHYGLWDRFAFGVFAETETDRDDLARSARGVVESRFGPVDDPRNLWIIGDTPLDVQCARAIGATAVAVLTGWHSRSELEGAAPDYLLADLTQSAPLLSAWGID